MTNDLARRISEHRAGEIPGFTADYRCTKLIYYEHCTDVQDAIAREKQLKKWSRSKKVALIASLNPRWKGSGAGDPRRIVRDVSTALDMTKGALNGVAISSTAHFRPLLSFRAKSRNL